MPMQDAAQVRTFGVRCGQPVPVMVRTGHVPPSAGIAGLAGGDVPLQRALDILAACGLPPPATPAIDIRPARPQAWPGLDLPLIVALLIAQGRIDPESLERLVLTAEVTATGQLDPIDGIEAVAVQTAIRGLVLLCAGSQARDAAQAGGGEVIGAASLGEVLAHLTGGRPLALVVAKPAASSTGMAERPARLAGLAPDEADFAPLTPVADPDPSASTGPPSPFSSAGPKGHRGRMRDRVLERGCASLADYELLEMLLFLAFKTGDTKPLAKRLINRFGSFAGVLAAPQAELMAAPGLGPHAVTSLLIVRAAAERLSRAELAERPLLNNWDRLIGHLTTVMAREKVEQFRVLFLDTRNRLLADEVQGHGTVNHTPVYPREVLKRALELQATAMILVHNHPSGDPTPSEADIDMTQEIRRAATALGIVLHDHIIIGAEGWCSLRRELLM